MLKKIINSRIIRLILSAVLIYFAFSRVDVKLIIQELAKVPIWFIFVNLILFSIVLLLAAYRWSLLLFDHPRPSHVLNFTKAAYLGGFYSLFFPTTVAGDLLKWLPLQKKYPELTKSILISSVFLDRFMGFAGLVFVAFLSVITGILLKISIPVVIIYFFIATLLALGLLLLLIFFTDIENIFEKIPFVKNINHLILLLKKTNKKKLMLCFLIAIATEFAWITPVWLSSLVFDAGFTLISVYIFLPIIAMVLVLPISFAGFGAREQLYLFFFTQIGLVPEKILLVSAFSGIINILNSLVGGIFLLF